MCLAGEDVVRPHGLRNSLLMRTRLSLFDHLSSRRGCAGVSSASNLGSRFMPYHVAKRLVELKLNDGGTWFAD